MVQKLFTWIFNHEPGNLHASNDEIAGILGAVIVWIFFLWLPQPLSWIVGTALFLLLRVIYELAWDAHGWEKGQDVITSMIAFVLTMLLIYKK